MGGAGGDCQQPRRLGHDTGRGRNGGSTSAMAMQPGPTGPSSVTVGRAWHDPSAGGGVRRRWSRSADGGTSDGGLRTCGTGVSSEGAARDRRPAPSTSTPAHVTSWPGGTMGLPMRWLPAVAPGRGVLGSVRARHDAGVRPEPEVCPASEDWLPNTPPLEMFQPLPHPATECPFYRGGWQNFLVATQPDADGRPALLDLPDHRHGVHAEDARARRTGRSWGWSSRPADGRS